MTPPYLILFIIVKIFATHTSCSTTTPEAPQIPRPVSEPNESGQRASSATGKQASTKAASKEKKPARQHLRQGHQYAQDGLFREALREYQLHLHQHANHPEALRAMGIVQVRTGQYVEAIKSLEKARQSYQIDFETNYYLAEAYRTQDRFDDAIFHYRVALKANPQHVQAMKALAWSYFQIRFYRGAFEVARELKKLAPNDVQVDIILARILNQMGRQKQALSIIRKSIVLSDPSQQPFLRSVLGDIFHSMGDCKQAEAVYREALRDQPLLAGALLGLGRCLLSRNEQVEMAREFVERALRLRPRMTEGYYWLAKSYETTQPERAARYYAQFQKRAAGDPAFRSQLEASRSRLSSIRGRDTTAQPETRPRREAAF